MRASEAAVAPSIAANPMQQLPHPGLVESRSLQEGAVSLAQHGDEREGNSCVTQLAGGGPGSSSALRAVSAAAAKPRSADANEKPTLAQMPLKEIATEEARAVGATAAVGALAS
jgi:hypothetical protein